MIFILIPLLSLNYIQTQDFCLDIKPNGAFDGIQVFRRWNGSTPEYVMYRNGKEWVFNIRWNRLINEPIISINKTSVKGISSHIINRFGFWNRDHNTKFDCHVKKGVKIYFIYFILYLNNIFPFNSVKQ